jgi:hypothetical protein
MELRLVVRMGGGWNWIRTLFVVYLETPFQWLRLYSVEAMISV